MRVEPHESHAYDFARQAAQLRRRRSANGQRSVKRTRAPLWAAVRPMDKGSHACHRISFSS